MATNANHPVIILRPVKVFVYFLCVAVMLLLLNLTGLWLAKISGDSGFFTNALVFFFDASAEGNIPTLFTVLMLFLASMFLLLIYYLPGEGSFPSNKKYWLSLSFIFLFLTIDEAARVHEQFNKIGDLLPTDESGYFAYPWILPYSIVVFSTGFFFLRFLFRLPSRTRKLFLVSGFIYVSSALGFELFEGRVSKIYEISHLYDKLLCAIEEFLEMMGVIIFIYALLDYFCSSQRTVLIGYTRQPVPENK